MSRRFPWSILSNANGLDATSPSFDCLVEHRPHGRDRVPHRVAGPFLLVHLVAQLLRVRIRQRGELHCLKSRVKLKSERPRVVLVHTRRHLVLDGDEPPVAVFLHLDRLRRHPPTVAVQLILDVTLTRVRRALVARHVLPVNLASAIRLLDVVRLPPALERTRDDARDFSLLRSSSGAHQAPSGRAGRPRTRRCCGGSPRHAPSTCRRRQATPQRRATRLDKPQVLTAYAVGSR